MTEQFQGLVYLATPYSHPDPEVRRRRFDVANQVAAKLMGRGLHIFSPISHTHPIAEAGDLPKGWEFWERYDRMIIRCCSGMFVLMQDGWKESVGVRAEMRYASEVGIPVKMLDVGAADQVVMA